MLITPLNFQEQFNLAIKESDKENLISLMNYACNNTVSVTYELSEIETLYKLIVNEKLNLIDEMFLDKVLSFYEKNKINMFVYDLLDLTHANNNEMLFVQLVNKNTLDIQNPYTARFIHNFTQIPFLNLALNNIAKQLKNLNPYEKLDMIHYFLQTTLEMNEFNNTKDNVVNYFFNNNLKPYQNGASFFRLALNNNYLTLNTWQFIIDNLHQDKDTNFTAKQIYDYLKEHFNDRFSSNSNLKESLKEYINILEEKDKLSLVINHQIHLDKKIKL